MKKVFWILVFMLIAGAAAWAAEEAEEGWCSEKLRSCEVTCAEDVVCKLRCWEEKAQCIRLTHYKSPAKQSVSFAPYSVTFTVRFF